MGKFFNTSTTEKMNATEWYNLRPVLGNAN